MTTDFSVAIVANNLKKNSMPEITSEQNVALATPKLGCNYWHRGSTYECRGDGYLWDADDDGFDPEDHSSPCPQCNTLEYLRSAQEEAESVSYASFNTLAYTGESLWANAVAIARRVNPEVAEAALKSIGTVVALRPHETEPNATVEVVFTY